MSEKSEETTRKPLEVEIEPLEFNAIESTVYITSNDFLHLTSEFFKAVFADCEGCRLNLNGSEPVIEVVFNHNVRSKDAIVCCELGNAKTTGNSVIDRQRTRDFRITEGDRYMITENGKDVVMPLLTNRYYNGGKPSWKNIVYEYVDQNQYNMYQIGRAEQFTIVTGISLERMAAKLYGTKTEDKSDNYEYAFEISPLYMQPNFQNSPASNYMIKIKRVSSKEVKKAYGDIGMSLPGDGFIR